MKLFPVEHQVGLILQTNRDRRACLRALKPGLPHILFARMALNTETILCWPGHAVAIYLGQTRQIVITGTWDIGQFADQVSRFPQITGFELRLAPVDFSMMERANSGFQFSRPFTTERMKLVTEHLVFAGTGIAEHRNTIDKIHDCSSNYLHINRLNFPVGAVRSELYIGISDPAGHPAMRRKANCA
jgi:hypothetical protein